MSIVEISLDDIPVAGKDWSPAVTSQASSRPQVKGITVSYPSVSHAPPAPTTKPKRSILKSVGGEGAKSRKRVRFNNRGRPTGGVRDKSAKCIDEIPVPAHTRTPAVTPAPISTSTSTTGMHNSRIKSK